MLRLCLYLLIYPLEGPLYENALLNALVIIAVKPALITGPTAEASFRWATP